MVVKIFVLGDSFSYHDHVEVMESWPGVMSTLGDYVIYNGSVPGSSNDSLFYRYLELERQYGKPDLTLVQLTYMCRIWYMTPNQQILHMDPIANNYHVTYSNYKNTTVTFTGFGDAAWETRFAEYTGVNIDRLKSFYELQHPFHFQEWRTQKEIHLLSSYDKNCVFFSWDIDFSPFINNIDIQYIGSVHQLMRFSYKSYWQTPTNNHYIADGHVRLAQLLSGKIQKYIKGC